MTKLRDDVREVLTDGNLAHLVTLNPDGTPQVSIVWVGVESEDGGDDEVVCAHLPEHRKIRNIRRDDRVALSMTTGVRNRMGLDEYLVVHGTARITEGGAPELLQRLAHIYIGPDARFPPMDDPPPGFVTRIAIERIGGIGPWAPMPGG